MNIWVRLKWRFLRWRRKKIVEAIEAEPAVQALTEALSVPYPFPRCPLHPKRISTPLGRNCCYDPVLVVEDLAPVMKNVVFDAKAIRLYHPR